MQLVESCWVEIDACNRKAHILTKCIYTSWYKCCLCNCNQYVRIDKVESSMETIIRGLPQGSTLGPLLFLLYISQTPLRSFLLECLQMIKMLSLPIIKQKILNLQ